MPNNYTVGPKSTRVFAGFKLPSVDLKEFYSELGETFMPGTPYMQAPMGLNAYLPAVLDIEAISADLSKGHAEALPDEVALIVYANLEIYETAKKLSLRRRMYTHSHHAVFQMDAPGGGGQFPGPANEPSERGERLSWNLFDAAVDWQDGVSQLLFAVSSTEGGGDPSGLNRHLETRKKDLAAVDADQVIALATPNYAVIWIHSSKDVNPESLDLFDESYPTTHRTLTATPVEMPLLEEDMAEQITIDGIKITGPSMFTFRFQRDPRFPCQP